MSDHGTLEDFFAILERMAADTKTALRAAKPAEPPDHCSDEGVAHHDERANPTRLHIGMSYRDLWNMALGYEQRLDALQEELGRTNEALAACQSEHSGLLRKAVREAVAAEKARIVAAVRAIGSRSTR